MLAQLFPRFYLRYVNSPVAYWLGEFANWLVLDGYAHCWAQLHVRHLKQVLERGSPGLSSPDFPFSAVSLDKLFAPWRRNVRFCYTRAVFRRFLVERHRFIAEPSSSRFSVLLEAYGRHLSELRGYAASTVRNHLRGIEVFLEKTLESGGSLQDLSADAVEQFVIEEGRRVKRQSLQDIVAQLRSFLRFCHDRGAVRQR